VSKPERISEYWRLSDPPKVMEASRRVHACRAVWLWPRKLLERSDAGQLAFADIVAPNIGRCSCGGDGARTENLISVDVLAERAEPARP